MIVSAPAKVILFGEWAVLEGGPGIVTALSPRFTAKYQAGAGALQLSDESHEAIEDFSFARELIAHLAKVSGSEALLQGRLSFERAWPLAEGLGSSSALAACLGALCSSPSGEKKFHPTELWQKILPALAAAQGGRASGLDLAAQIFGGTVILKGEAGPQPFTLQIPLELRLIHTGQKLSTREALKRKAAAESMAAIAHSAAAFAADTDRWLPTMDEHFEALCRMDLVPSDIRAAREDWLSRGWIKALKTTGAGGGDALLCWTEAAAQKDLQTDLINRGWWISHYSWNAPGLRIEGPAASKVARP